MIGRPAWRITGQGCRECAARVTFAAVPDPPRSMCDPLAMRGHYDRLAALALRIERYGLRRLELPMDDGFVRVTTLIEMHGAGAEGVGEDVTYEAEDHDRLQEAGAVHDLTRVRTLGDLGDLLDDLDLFPAPPGMEAFRDYRRWAFESAGLDLALRQAGTSLAEALGVVPRAVRFVASMRFPEPPDAERLLRSRPSWTRRRTGTTTSSTWSPAPAPSASWT